MVLQALAPYYREAGADSSIKATVDAALAWLHGKQMNNGGFQSVYDYGTDINTCSTAQVVTALCALGIDPTDASWTKYGGHNPVTALLSNYNVEGRWFGTYSNKYYDSSTAMSTDQAAYALVAYDRLTKGLPGLYDMSDAFGTSKIRDDAAITAAKIVIEDLGYTVTQAEAPDEAAALAKIESLIGGLDLKGVSHSVNKLAYEPAVAGTPEGLGGANGRYAFTVTLNKGNGDAQTTRELTLRIAATAYDPAGDDADIALAKALIEGAAYRSAQEETPDEASAHAKVGAVIGGLPLNGVAATVQKVTYVPATAGSEVSALGVDGGYLFTAALSKGAGAPQVTETLTLSIKASAYAAGQSKAKEEKAAKKKAKAKAKKVNIKFAANGGKISVTKSGKSTKVSAYTKKLTVGKKFGSLPKVSRNGLYQFTGWYTAKSGGKKVTAKTAVYKKSRTLYARWQAQYGELKDGIYVVKVRAAADVNAPVKGYVSGSVKFRIVKKVDRPGESGDWYEVSYKAASGKTVTGYVYAPFVGAYWAAA
jgi:uncharacterized repeat protein (TIGR02543 family)